MPKSATPWIFLDDAWDANETDSNSVANKIHHLSKPQHTATKGNVSTSEEKKLVKNNYSEVGEHFEDHEFDELVSKISV